MKFILPDSRAVGAPAQAGDSRRSMASDPRAAAVQEMQGLYGPFAFPERLLQRLWRMGEFDARAACLADGRPVEVLHPGRWNLLGGPDFRDAELRFAGIPVRGDVELHLHAGDWDAHRHAGDRAYDRVVLHVVLFPPPPGCRSRDRLGNVLPELVLLPLLRKGLEELATDDAMERIAGTDEARHLDGIEQLAEAAPRILREEAGRRWEQKVHFASVRIRRLGWTEACHTAALEILGYRFNRAAMLRLAAAWPFGRWLAAPPSVGALIASQGSAWARQGMRPSNLPSNRLRQYGEWMMAAPDWPDRLTVRGEELQRVAAAAGEGASEFRRRASLKARREEWIAALTGNRVAGSRFDTLVCDGFLPLLAARGIPLESAWLHWYAGDQPPFVARVLQVIEAGDSGAGPLSNGVAQGLLGWLLGRERLVPRTPEGAAAGQKISRPIEPIHPQNHEKPIP